MIFRQITGGIYYLVKWVGSAGNALGTAFEIYIGQVLEAMAFAPRYTTYAQEVYGDEKRTVDWMLGNESEALFIECKTKRVTATTREELINDGSNDKDLEDMADAVVQVYKTMVDYQENKYPSLKYLPERKVYPMIVTMEEWFLMGTKIVALNKMVRQKMEALSLPLAQLESKPFSICSAQEFEMLLQVLKSESIGEVVEGKQTDQEMVQWSYAPYIRKKYMHLLNKDYEIFPHIFREILPISIGQNPNAQDL
jgi:hypothetical protein